MTELPALTGAELQATREFLGLTTGWLASNFVISERRLLRMEAGTERIPAVICTFLDELYDDTKEQVAQMVAQYRRKVKASAGDVVTLLTYRTDEDYRSAGGKYPARWHRQMCARVVDAVPGLVLVHSE